MLKIIATLAPLDQVVQHDEEADWIGYELFLKNTELIGTEAALNQQIKKVLEKRGVTEFETKSLCSITFPGNIHVSGMLEDIHGAFLIRNMLTFLVSLKTRKRTLIETHLKDPVQLRRIALTGLERGLELLNENEGVSNQDKFKLSKIILDFLSMNGFLKDNYHLFSRLCHHLKKDSTLLLEAVKNNTSYGTLLESVRNYERDNGPISWDHVPCIFELIDWDIQLFTFQELKKEISLFYSEFVKAISLSDDANLALKKECITVLSFISSAVLKLGGTEADLNEYELFCVRNLKDEATKAFLKQRCLGEALVSDSEFSLFLFDLHDEKKVKEKSQELKQCFKALVFIGEKDKYETHRLLSKHIKEKTDASLADYFAEEEGFDAIRFFKERLFSRIQKKVELSEDSTQIGMYRELVVDSAAELGKPDQIFDLMSSNTLEQRRERSGRYVMSYMRSFVRANRSPVGDEIQLIEKGVKEHASKFVLNSYMNLLNSLNFPISKIVQLMSLKNDDGINIVYGDLINYVTFLRILSQDLQLSRDEKTNWVNDCVRAVYKNNGKLLDERSREDQLSFELECLAVLVKSSSYEEVTQFITAYGNIITEQQERYRYFSISMEALFYDTQMRMEEKVSCVIDMMSKMEDEDYSKRWVTLALDMFEQSGHSGLVNKIIGKVSTIYQLRAFLETVKFKLTIKRCKENYQKTRKTIQTLLGSPKKKLLTADEKVALSNAKNWLLQLDEKVKTEYAAFQDKLNLKIMGLKDKNKASYTVERVANDVYDCIVDYHLVHYTDFNSKLSYFLSCYPKSVPLSKKSNQVQVEDLETAYEQDSYTYTMHLGVSALNFFIKDSATVLFFSTDKTKIALELCLVFQFFRVCSTIEKNQVEDPLPSWDKSYAKEFQDLATCYESYQSKSEFELRTTFETLLNQWNSKIAKGYLVYLLKVAQVGAYTLIETIMSEIKRRHPNEIQEEDYHYLLKALNNNRNMLPEVKLEHVKNITYNVLVRNSECRSAHETMSQTLPKLLFPELYNLELNAILKASKNWFAQIQTYTEANVSDYFSDLKQLFSQYLNLQSSLMGLCEQGVDKTGSEARLRVKKGQHGLPYVECNTKDGGFLEGFLGYLYTKREGEWSGLPYRCRNLVDILFITCSKKQDDYTRFTHTQDEMRLLQWNEDRYFKIENKNVKELDSFLFLDSEALLKTAIGDIMEKLWIYFIERVNQLLDTKSICSERLFKDAFIIYASLGAFPQLGEVLQFLKQSKDERLNLYSGRFVSLFFKSFLFSTDPSAAIFLKATLKSMASAVLDQEKQALLQTYIESHFSKEKHEELIYNILDLLFGAYSGVERDKKMSSFLDATALTIPNLDERREFSDMLIKAQDKMELTTLEQQEMHAEINHWKERAGHFKSAFIEKARGFLDTCFEGKLRRFEYLYLKGCLPNTQGHILISQPCMAMDSYKTLFLSQERQILVYKILDLLINIRDDREGNRKRNSFLHFLSDHGCDSDTCLQIERLLKYPPRDISLNETEKQTFTTEIIKGRHECKFRSDYMKESESLLARCFGEQTESLIEQCMAIFVLHDTNQKIVPLSVSQFKYVANRNRKKTVMWKSPSQLIRLGLLPSSLYSAKERMAVSQLDTWGTDISTDQCTNLKNQFLTRYDQSVVQLNYHGVNSESAAHILGCFVKYKMVDEFRYYVRIDFEAKEITFPHWKHVSWQEPQSRYTAQIQLNLLKFALLPGAFSEKADVRRFLELFFSRRVQAYDCQYSLAVIGYFSQHPSENKPDLKPLIDSEFVSGQLIVHKMEDTTTVYQIEKYAKKNKCMSTDIIDARHVGKGTVVSFELNKQEKTLKIDKDPCLNHEKMVFTAPSDLAVSKENWCIVSGEAKRIEEYASYLGNMKLLEDPLLCLGLKSGLINYAKCLTVQEVSRKNQLREALLSEKRPEVDEKAFRLALYQYLIFAISPETNKQILSQEFNSLSQMLKSKAMTLLKEYVACALSLARMKKELLREFSTVSSLLKENAVELKMALLQICSDYTDCHSYYWNLKHPILSISILRSFIDSIFKTDDSVLQSQVSPNLDQVIHPNYQLLIPEQYKTKYKKGEKFLYPVTPAKLKLYLSLSYLIMFIRATLFQAQKIDDFQAFFVDIQYCLKRVFRAALMCQDSTIGDVLLDELKSNQQLNKQKGTIQEEPFLSLANSLKLYPALFTIQEIKLVLFPKGELRQLGPFEAVLKKNIKKLIWKVRELISCKSDKHSLPLLKKLVFSCVFSDISKKKHRYVKENFASWMDIIYESQKKDSSELIDVCFRGLRDRFEKKEETITVFETQQDDYEKNLKQFESRLKQGVKTLVTNQYMPKVNTSICDLDKLKLALETEIKAVEINIAQYFGKIEKKLKENCLNKDQDGIISEHYKAILELDQFVYELDTLKTTWYLKYNELCTKECSQLVSPFTETLKRDFISDVHKLKDMHSKACFREDIEGWEKKDVKHQHYMQGLIDKQIRRLTQEGMQNESDSRAVFLKAQTEKNLAHKNWLKQKLNSYSKVLKIISDAAIEEHNLNRFQDARKEMQNMAEQKKREIVSFLSAVNLNPDVPEHIGMMVELSLKIKDKDSIIALIQEQIQHGLTVDIMLQHFLNKEFLSQIDLGLTRDKDNVFATHWENIVESFSDVFLKPDINEKISLPKFESRLYQASKEIYTNDRFYFLHVFLFQLHFLLMTRIKKMEGNEAVSGFIRHVLNQAHVFDGSPSKESYLVCIRSILLSKHCEPDFFQGYLEQEDDYKAVLYTSFFSETKKNKFDVALLTQKRLMPFQATAFSKFWDQVCSPENLDVPALLEDRDQFATKWQLKHLERKGTLGNNVLKQFWDTVALPIPIKTVIATCLLWTWESGPNPIWEVFKIKEKDRLSSVADFPVSSQSQSTNYIDSLSLYFFNTALGLLKAKKETRINERFYFVMNIIRKCMKDVYDVQKKKKPDNFEAMLQSFFGLNILSLRIILSDVLKIKDMSIEAERNQSIISIVGTTVSQLCQQVAVNSNYAYQFSFPGGAMIKIYSLIFQLMMQQINVSDYFNKEELEVLMLFPEFNDYLRSDFQKNKGCLQKFAKENPMRLNMFFYRLLQVVLDLMANPTGALDDKPLILIATNNWMPHTSDLGDFFFTGYLKSSIFDGQVKISDFFDLRFENLTTYFPLCEKSEFSGRVCDTWRNYFSVNKSISDSECTDILKKINASIAHQLTVSAPKFSDIVSSILADSLGSDQNFKSLRSVSNQFHDYLSQSYSNSQSKETSIDYLSGFAKKIIKKDQSLPLSEFFCSSEFLGPFMEQGIQLEPERDAPRYFIENVFKEDVLFQIDGSNVRNRLRNHYLINTMFLGVLKSLFESNQLSVSIEKCIQWFSENELILEQINRCAALVGVGEPEAYHTGSIAQINMFRETSLIRTLVGFVEGVLKVVSSKRNIPFTDAENIEALFNAYSKSKQHLSIDSRLIYATLIAKMINELSTLNEIEKMMSFFMQGEIIYTRPYFAYDTPFLSLLEQRRDLPMTTHRMTIQLRVIESFASLYFGEYQNGYTGNQRFQDWLFQEFIVDVVNQIEPRLGSKEATLMALFPEHEYWGHYSYTGGIEREEANSRLFKLLFPNQAETQKTEHAWRVAHQTWKESNKAAIDRIALGYADKLKTKLESPSFKGLVLHRKIALFYFFIDIVLPRFKDSLSATLKIDKTASFVINYGTEKEMLKASEIIPEDERYLSPENLMAHIEVNYDRWVFLFDAQLNAAESNQNMCVDSFKALVVFQRHLMDSIMSLNRYFLLCKIGFSGVNRNGFLLPAYSLFKQLMDVSDSFMKRLATVLQTSPRQKELMDIVKKTYQSHFYKGVLEINKVDQRAFYSSEDAFSELARTNKYTESYFAKPYNPTHVDLDQKQLSEAIQLLSNELKGYEKMVSDLEDNGAHLRNLKQYDQRLLAARVKDRELNDSFLKKAKLALLEKEKSLGHSITENRREQIDRSLASGVVAQATPRFPSELGLAYYFLYFRFESVRSRLRLME